LEWHLERRKSVGYETNFHFEVTDPDAIIIRARETGCRLLLFYVGLPSVWECKRRVQDRVEKGGHYVPFRVIENRFEKGLQNLRTYFASFDLLEIYDNSDKEIRLLIIAQKGTIYYQEENLPAWVKHIAHSK